MPNFSIIMPVYNVEKYLKKSITSIRDQSFKDFELICIDDCSNDNSLKVLNMYASKDKRIKVLHHDINKGVSVARNTGLDNATGKYIVFVDPDDWIDISLLKRVNEILENIQVDSVMFNHFEVYPDGKKIRKDNQNENTEALVCVTSKTMYQIRGCVWNYAYRKSKIDEMNLRFPEGLIVEDDEFTFKYFVKNKLLYRLNKPLYYYRKEREESYTQHKKDLIVSDSCKIAYRIYQWLIDENYFNEYKRALLALIGSRILNMTLSGKTTFYTMYLGLLDKIGFPEQYEDINTDNPLLNNQK